MSETLKARCRAFLSKQQRRAIMRTGDPVQELFEFVIAESGRKAAPELDETMPLCLYFKTDVDREDFIALVQHINPNMTARKVQ